ncbi:hypothetical protein O181_030691 [Austropuccinia psidii MF-1]|uniref:Uncharacterized protein n=1 Tax=Austropuccinia psidii MF-1 TaxID=1389203 RepID=A0A9Q3H4H4_9BASI|nr:hypothetical protein [Austropuccinia psidii MF-1]
MAAESTSSKFFIPILTENNFNEWNSAIRPYFVYQDLLDQIEGYMPIPSRHHEDYKSFRTRAMKCAGVLAGTLSSTNRARFITKENEKDPGAIYQQICSYFASNDSKNQAKVFANLLSIKFKSGQIHKFTTAIRGQLKLMKSVGLRIGESDIDFVDISDSLLAEIILSKLPYQFSGFKEILTQQRPLSAEKVLNRLDGL